MGKAVVTEIKPWHTSKTLWFNAIVAGLATMESSVGMLQPYVPGNVYSYFVVALTVGNAVLRIVTTQGLGRA